MIKYSKFQKIIALLFVFILFFVVGYLFFSISKKNKEKTIILRNKVIEQQKERALNEKLNNLRLASTTIPVLNSKAYLTLAVSYNGLEKVIFDKNTNLVLPIASLTKLMVAVIVMENINLDTEITATRDYIGKEESYFVLEAGRKYTVREILSNALISSDNDSARLLSSLLGVDNFITKMNLKASELGLSQTRFVNVTGLDPADFNEEFLNISTVTDLANLLIYIKKTHPEILKITTNSSYNFCDIDNYCKLIMSTNKLLNNPDFPFKIIGGKTGSTDLAGKNLVLFLNYFDDILLINIVLGAEDNFADTLSIISHIN